MLAELYQLAQGQGAVAERAQIALSITEQHQRGEISDAEYQELMMDLVRLDEVAEQSADIEARALLVAAVFAVAKLA
jgi:hypothetical protein